jgi:hypothetical protein
MLRWTSTAQRTASTTLTNFHQHAVAGGLDDAASMLSNLAVDKFLTMNLELAQRTFLVDTHQPTISGDVGR